MIFHRDDGVAGLLRGGEDHVLRQRLHAVSIDDRDGDAFSLQLIRRLERLKQRHAGADDGGLGAFAQHFRAADGEFLVVAVDHRRLRARGAQELEAARLGHFFQQFFRGHGVRRIQHGTALHRAENRDVFQRHLRRTVLADADADVRTDQLQIGRGNAGDADLVRGAGEECRECRGERHMAARAETDGDGDEVLFRDETFGETVRERLVEFFRVGGILRVAVHRDDRRIGFAHADERRAVGFARGDGVTELVADGRIARGRGEVRGGQGGWRGNRDAETGLGARRKFGDGLRGFFRVERLAVPAVFVL